MTGRRILLGEHDSTIAGQLQQQLSEKGYEIDHCLDGEATLDRLYQTPPDLAILDVKLPRTDGFKVATVIRSVPSSRDLPLIILTDLDSSQNEIIGQNLGANHYMTKPYSFEDLHGNIESALKGRDPVAESNIPELSPEWSAAETGIVVRSADMLRILDRLRQVAGVNATVLVRGETGVGKNLMARALHRCSPRGEGPFVEIECPTLAESVIESDLFRHEKGAFTGANHERHGKLEAAKKGTLFLDEVGDLSLRAQARLLGLLERREVIRVGGSKTIRVDARLVLATNRNLEKLVRQGKFRENLYYRIKEIQMTVPPLRKRPEDISKLITHFVDAFNLEMGKTVAGVSRVVLAQLLRHHWPGNIRELRNTISAAMTYVQTGELWLEHMPPIEGAMPPRPGSHPPTSLREMERQHVELTLAYCGWNKSRAASMLGITRATLDRKIKDNGLQDPRVK